MMGDIYISVYKQAMTHLDPSGFSAWFDYIIIMAHLEKSIVKILMFLIVLLKLIVIRF